MTSPVGHTLVGVACAGAAASIMGAPASPALWLGAMVASNLPDLDWIAVVGGAPIRQVHRKASHSWVTLGGVILLVWAAGRWLPGGIDGRLIAAWSAALLSHPVVDALTTSPHAARQGFGIPLLWPVSRRTWCLQPPIFPSAELPAYRTLRGIMHIALTEAAYLGPAAIAIALVGRLLERLVS